ncbi:MAG TPA: glycosyltransferase [Puia sp.]|jgi:glycosyltransferase involved in cell wall biosynthesis|nr:glycosyltransferase [Puia sp.]
MNQDIRKKKIVWVTPDNFLDSDFNPYLFNLLLATYNIKWVIILPKSGGFFNESNFEELNRLKGLEIQFVYTSYRQRDPRRLFFYALLYRKINITPYDLLYLSYGPADPYAVPFFWALNKKKTIFAVHEGHVNDNFKLPYLSKILLNSTYRYAIFVHMFSSFAANVFHQHYPKAKIFMTNMALKSFGESNLQKCSDTVIFLSFGIINHAKNIDLLIEAACNIYERGHKGFKISINGSCSNWDFYQSKIRYPEIFICDIRMIQNSEIPDLFARSHYLVQPYRSTSQSGVLKIALNYNVPIIASDLPGFREEIEEGVNGFFFKAGDVKELENVMIKILNEHDRQYAGLLERQRKDTVAKYDTNKINSKYIDMFKYVIG